ncbi:MAG: ABC transporter ATP-binding protein, partial [Spirochaetales bacterium]|nr:ABC transporter ATP-binding protein [Spirochaetales bacterium]
MTRQSESAVMQRIKVTNLEKRYGNEQALKGISFEVASGEIFTIVGPNGSGKTTTMEIVEGIRTHNSGDISVLGGNPRERRIKQKIGVQIQDSQPMSNLTPLEAARLFRSFYKSGLDPMRALELVHLEHKKKTLVRNLSSGQKKRLELALAVINDPEVVFLDEPTTGLDPNARRVVWEIIKDLKRKNTSVLFTTHYMDEAESISDRVAILHLGKIVALDSPKCLISASGLQNRITFSCKVGGENLVRELAKQFSSIRHQQG